MISERQHLQLVAERDKLGRIGLVELWEIKDILLPFLRNGNQKSNFYYSCSNWWVFLKEWEVQRKITVTNLLKQIHEVLPQMWFLNQTTHEPSYWGLGWNYLLNLNQTRNLGVLGGVVEKRKEWELKWPRLFLLNYKKRKWCKNFKWWKKTLNSYSLCLRIYLDRLYVPEQYLKCNLNI